MALNVVGIVCALPAEARHLGSTVPLNKPLGSLADGTLVAVTGMGSSAATAGANALVAAGAGALASWGMAGGLDPELAAGSVLLPEEVIGAGAGVVKTSEAWRSRLTRALAPDVPVRGGRLISTLGAVGTVADKAALFENTGAAAVDMESAAVGEVAERNQLPYIAVRVIVDCASDVLPRAVSAAADQQGHLRIWRLIGALALAPGELAPLIRLARRYGAANRSLARIARRGSLAPSAFSSPDSRLS